MRENLKQAFEKKSWASGNPNAPRSGPGSDMPQTEAIRAALPDLFARYEVKRFLDAPCGDWFWMQHVDLEGVEYLGLDISSEVVEANRTHETNGVSFGVLDVTSDPLPDADMMMCRDCLFHLKHQYKVAFFDNFLASSIPYLLTTSHTNINNMDLQRNGGFRHFNMQAAPFRFPEPLEIIIERDSEFSSPKEALGDMNFRYMGLWSRAQVASTLEVIR
jgi:SAM-dependent methyltransferase